MQNFVLGMILQTCFSMFVHFTCLQEKTVRYSGKFASLFGHTEMFVVHFLARDCNACFSQIIEIRTFSYLNE